MKQREFNVRIVLDEKDEAYLGFVYGFYKTGKKEDGKEVIMQKDVPESVREKLAKKLNSKLLAKVPSQMKHFKK